LLSSDLAGTIGRVEGDGRASRQPRWLAVPVLALALAACSGSTAEPPSSSGSAGWSGSTVSSGSWGSSESPLSVAGTATPGETSSRTLTATGTTMSRAAARVLASYGWAVTSASQLSDPGDVRRTELHLVIRKSPTSTGSAWVAAGTTSTVELVRYDDGADLTQLRVNRCTSATCDDRRDYPSCPIGIDCVIGGQARPSATVDGLVRGSLITWGRGELTGRAAESVIGTDPAKPDAPVAVLPDQAGYDLLNAVVPRSEDLAGTVSGVVRGHGGPATPAHPRGAYTGQPLPGYDLVFTDAVGDSVTVTTDARGRYSVSLSPGTWAVACGARAHVAVAAGARTTLDCDVSIR